MPVSRKRRKKSKSGGRPVRSQRSVLDGLSGMLEHRRRIDEHRMRVAGPVAAGMVADLVDLAAHASDADLEDALCVRFGRQVNAWDNGGVLADMVGPDQLLIALAEAAVSAVRIALVTPEERRGPWRVLTAVCHLAAGPPQVVIDDLVADLWELSEVPTLPEGPVLPVVPAGPTPTGRALWARNHYGSRFCVLAEFSAGGLPRWYLWDIDACGREPVAVHGAYHPSAEVGLSEWRAMVGETADDATLMPVDDLTLLVELLPQPEGAIRYGGEGADLLAEYHRSRRLALKLLETFDPAEFVQVESLAASAAEEFLAWLREHRPDAVAEPAEGDEDDDEPVDLEDLAAELAESWCSSGITAIYHACSPHRLAQVVPLVRDFYREPFADRLVELLPAWSDWLAERNGTPLELAERCRPYATGAPGAGPLSAEDPDRYARVRE